MDLQMLNSIPRIYMCMLMSGPHSLDYGSFVVGRENEKCESSNFVLVFKAGWGYSCFPYEL